MSGQLLEAGQLVRTSGGQDCVVGRLLGSGGQGEVYSCRWGSQEVALKWYFSHTATSEQRECLERLVRERSPRPSFLWPEELVTAPGSPGFGYLMQLRPAHFRSLNDFMSGAVSISAIPLIDATLELTRSMRALHLNGLCYRDISFGNAFIDPKDGHVLICDNDNVTVNRTAWSGVRGTMQFMAPEVLGGKPPTTLSDQHSLAVLLFFMFCVGHPLMGRRMLNIRIWDVAAQEHMFWKDPIFIFDPANRVNEAVEKAYDPSGEAGGTALAFWRTYPKSLRDTFTKAFTAGLRDPQARPTELEWMSTLSALRDAVLRCQCGSANYYDPVVKNGVLQPLAACWSCGHSPRIPPRIRIDKKVVMLNHDSSLYAHHIDGKGDNFDFSKALASVVRHPTIPDVWGLKNTGQTPWTVTLSTGTVKNVDPGQSAPLVDGTRVSFGRMEGVIRT
ncbi:MAG: protein kinase [Pseudomonadota bacterium]